MEQPHDGLILRNILEHLGVKNVHLSEKIKKHPNTITNWLASDRIDNTTLIEIGKVLRYDMTADYPRLRFIPEAMALTYFNQDPEKVLNEVREVKALYYTTKQLQADKELQIQLLHEKISDLKMMIDAKNQTIDSLKSQIDILTQKKVSQPLHNNP